LLSKFPKAEKFAMAAQIKDSMFTVLRNILRANKIYKDKNKRIDMLNAIDAELQAQKVLVRIAHNNRYISNQNYIEWSRSLDEIGRILGGWIKATVG
jgi:four helix bundle protein